MALIAVKLGGEILLPPAAAEAAAVADDVRALCDRGDRVIVIHGGGPQTTELSRRLGIEPVVVAGRRVTDAPTLEAVKMAVVGRANVDLCARLVAAGVRAVGLHGASGPVLRARKRPPRRVTGGPPEPIDFGHVGDVVGFDRELLDALGAAGYVPVLACLGCDPETGALYNINADVVAAQLGAAVGADVLVLVTGAPGVLADPERPESRIPRLTEAEGRQAIAEGRIRGGMIPKLEEAFAALALGVRQILVVGRLAPGDLLRALEAPGSVGTVLLA